MDIVKRSIYPPEPSFFDDFLTKELNHWPEWSHNPTAVPKTNILETGGDFRVEVSVPGMKKNDFNLELDNEMLTIQAEVSNEWKNVSDGSYNLREFGYRPFKRSFYLPNTVEADKIEATYKNGILALLIPKKEEARKKPIKTITIS